MVVLMTLRIGRGLALAGVCLASVTGSAQSRKPIEIQAERFAFTPSKVTLVLGEEVEFRLTSDDTAHGFRIVDTDISVAIPKRGQGDIVVRFKPAKSGRYIFECSRMCGAGHNFMRGELVVKEPGRP